MIPERPLDWRKIGSGDLIDRSVPVRDLGRPVGPTGDVTIAGLCSPGDYHDSVVELLYQAFRLRLKCRIAQVMYRTEFPDCGR